MPMATLLAAPIAEGLGAIGLGGVATAAGGLVPEVLGGALEGAGVGAGLGAITGGSPGLGALTGALTGGALGGAGSVASDLGLGTASTTALETGVGAAAGAVGGAATGQSPLGGAILGGAGGLVSGLASGATPTTAVTPGAATGISAASLSPDSATIGGAADLASASASGGGNLGGGAGGGLVSGGGNLVPTTTSTTGASMSPLDTAAGMGVGTDAFGNLSLAAAPASPSWLDAATASLAKNPMALLAGGGLALDYLLTKPVSNMPEAQPLEQAAAQTAAQATSLESYLQSGTLPPGAAEAVRSATDAAKAQIRSNYANLGLGGSTMESQALGMADQNAAAMTFQIGDQLLAQGANFTQISSQLYQQILGLTIQQDTAFQQALGSFAGGLAGMGMRAAA